VTRIVHTADWHLGARLVERERHEEQAAFLDWLLTQLIEFRPELLIVAGDIFDSATPPQEALTLYYRFLGRLAATVKCRTLILGGNHDSPATLHAPRDILRAIEVRVIARPPADPAEGLLEFDDVVVCAVPYLRERDVRISSPGESADQVAAAIREGIVRHYRAVYTAAGDRAGARPIVATGHLTAVGCVGSPSERIIHIGNLGAVDAGCFEGFAYTALGHLHRPQPVGGNECVRYVGSPIPLSFAEVGVAKEIRVLDFREGQMTQRPVEIPAFRRLVRLTAATADLATTLAAHQAAPAEALFPWVELTVTDGRAHPDLDRQVREAAAGLRLEVLKILTPAATAGEGAAADVTPSPSLADLRPEEVFAARLRSEPIDPESADGQVLVATFAELLSGMHDAASGTKEGGA
jgi:exonuclease SbcD